MSTQLGYVNGVPKACAYCRELFTGHPERGRLGAIYCSKDCREWACDEPNVEDVARRVN